MGYQRIIVPKINSNSANKGQRASPMRVAAPAPAPAAVGKGAEGVVVECKTLFDAMAAAFANPEIAHSFANRKPSKSKNKSSGFRKVRSNFEEMDNTEFDEN